MIEWYNKFYGTYDQSTLYSVNIICNPVKYSQPIKKKWNTLHSVLPLM